MSQEDTFDVRIAHSSPLFTASPVTGDRTTGWATLCTASGYPCDAPDQSAVYTSLANATMELSFWGSRIEVRGNATGGMELAWELDGNAKTPDVGATTTERPGAIGEKLGSGFLGVFGGLDSGKMHTLRIITRPGLPSAVMAFEGAVVTVGTGVVGGTLTPSFLDDNDPMLKYTQTGWARYGEYTSHDFNITLPEGVTNGKFQCSKDPGTSRLGPRTQVLLYGPCYASNGAYTINLDNEPPVVYNASINAYSAPKAASVAGACLRYISPPLAADKLHYVSMANADKDRETNLDWVVVIGSPGGQPVSIKSIKPKTKSNIGAIAGAVAGSVALLLALLALLFFIRRRRHKAKRVTMADDASEDRKSTPLDLLSAQADLQSLSSEHKPSVLVSPSHGSGGSQGNERNYRWIEPFELPPLVDGVGNASGGKATSRTATSGGETSGAEASTSVPSPQQDTSVGSPARAASTRTASPPPVGAHASQPSTAPQPSSGLPSNTSRPTLGLVTTTSNASAQPRPVPDLSQISSDVNRILAQLGQIRRRADSNAPNGLDSVRSPVGGDEDDPPVDAPPEYGKHRRV
ncbi:hypothetical protein FRC10_009021 [Ceratobasidium sp. 414]|nr:hypothetical protein FRC10_009021 [Ceratobasidium sp. 414]